VRLMLLSAGIVLAVLGCDRTTQTSGKTSPASSQQQAETGQVIVITAADLSKSYKADRSAAAEKYNGKK
jgi:uncharacterized lipoprotein YajG